MDAKNYPAHSKQTAELTTQITTFYEQKRPFKIYHGSTNSTRIQVFKRDEMIDTSGLDHVLHVDSERKTVLVEPNVPMDKLVKETLRYGLIPPVVMEFPGITVGGGVQGGAGESSSFRYGAFQSICTAYEIITGDGKLVTCSKTKNSDLFYGTAGSCGTLGVMTAIELQLIQAKQYVHLTYIPISSFEESIQVLREVCNEEYDYIDSIMFGPDEGVIMAGTLSDRQLGNVASFRRARDEWFYLHAQQISKTRKEHTESVPLTDYLFRYDRGGFWVGAYAFRMYRVPFTRFWRWAYDWLLRTRKLFKGLQESGISQRMIVQDLALPQATAGAFMRYVDQTLGIYPLWICPLAADTESPFMPNYLDTPLVINVGVWGDSLATYEAFYEANRSIEKNLAKLGGRKCFYAHAYYDEEEFWAIYGKERYDLLREKYHASYLPSTYDKIRVRETYPITMQRGLWRTFFNLAKLRVTS